MKTRESGMPAEEVWRQFFDPCEILAGLGLRPEFQNVVDLGCGYGTFAVPAAAQIAGCVHAIDIDPKMVERTRAEAHRQGLANLVTIQRDALHSGTGLPAQFADFVMIFNLLHALEAAELLAEAHRILKKTGTLAVIHWNYDPATPRGPSMEIRLTPEACSRLIRESGFLVGPRRDFPPYHFGFTGSPV